MRIASCFLCLMLCSANAYGQNLLWEMMYDASGGTDVARAVTLSKRAAILIGNASNPADDVNDLVIQSLRRKNGSVLWTDRVPAAPGLVLDLQIASHQGRVFAAGYVPGAAVSSTDMVIRGYDALHGTLLWNSVWDAGRDDLPQALVAGPTAVVVVGYGGNMGGQPINFLVRAYEPGSGLILWEDRVERPDLATAAWTVAITRNRVFVAGTTQSTQARDLLLRAYDAFSGELVWETTRPSTTPTAIKVVAGRVFLAGSSFNSSYVGALDARNGEWLWEDDATGPSGGFGDLAVLGQRVVAAGSVGPNLLLRAYDASTGTVAWQDQPPVSPGYNDRATAVALNGRAVYVVGSTHQPFGPSEMLVRAYGVDGTPLWDDRSHRSVGVPGTSAVDVALGKNRLFVTGFVQGVREDFVIRAYDVRADGTASPLETASLSD
jgi:outer membrane protein assembly factor BamB